METIFDRLAQVGECWEWQGQRGQWGHGSVYFDGRTHPVHRVVYEDLRGPIPDGLELDHLCRNPPCCNPEHLDPVTHAVNMARGRQSFDVRTHCLRGSHELTPNNIYDNATNGRQQCRACRNETRNANRQRRKSLGLPRD